MLRKFIVLLGGLLLLMLPTSAHAATQANYDITYCDGGTLAGTGTNDLSNGKLSFGWCKTSTGKMTT